MVFCVVAAIVNINNVVIIDSAFAWKFDEEA